MFLFKYGTSLKTNYQPSISWLHVPHTHTYMPTHPHNRPPPPERCAMSTIFSLRAALLARTRTHPQCSFHQSRTATKPAAPSHHRLSAKKRAHTHTHTWHTYTHSADIDSVGVPQTRPCATQMAPAPCVRAGCHKDGSAATNKCVLPVRARLTRDDDIIRASFNFNLVVWRMRCGGCGDDAPLATFPSGDTRAHTHTHELRQKRAHARVLKSHYAWHQYFCQHIARRDARGIQIFSRC